MSQILLTDVRKKFLEYFKKNNHQIVESSNLVPNNDPTLTLRVNFRSAFTKILIPFDLFSNLVIKPWLKIIPLNIILFVKCN